MAVHFNAAGDYFLKTANLPNRTEVTVMLWVYLLNDRNASGDICVWTDTSNYQTVGLDLDGTTLKIATNNGTSTGTSLSTGAWNHIAYTRTGNSHTLYLNGVSDITRSDTISFTPAYFLLASNGSTSYIDGYLAHLKVYNTALGVNQIRSEMYSIQPFFWGGSLLGYWPMFPGTSERVRGYNGGGNFSANGTLSDVQGPARVAWNYDPPVMFVLPSAATITGTALLSGKGQAEAEAKVEVIASSSLLGKGQAQAEAQAQVLANAILTGAGKTETEARAIVLALTQLYGAGTLAGSGIRAVVSTALLTGKGQAEAEAKAIVLAGATLAGAGQAQIDAKAIVQALADLQGAGTLAGAGVRVVVSTARLLAEGDSSAEAKAIVMASSSLLGKGEVEAETKVEVLATGRLTGAGVLVGNGLAIVSGQVDATGHLTGKGFLSADAKAIVQALADLQGAGTLVGAGVRVVVSTARLLAEGDSSAEAKAIVIASSSLLGKGEVEAEAKVEVLATGRLTGAGVLVGNGLAIVIGEVQATAQLLGRGVLSAEAKAVVLATGLMNGAGLAQAGSVVTTFSGALLSGAGILVAEGGVPIAITMVIEEALFAQLSASAGVSALISSRIYPQRLPQNPTLPAVVYQREQTTRPMAHDGPLALASPRFEVLCFGSTYAGVEALAEAIKAEIDGFKGTLGGSNGVSTGAILCLDEQDDYDPATDSYVISLDFLILHTE